MSYCELCAQVKEPFRMADRCETCGTLILPDALYCKNCAAPETNNLTIFRKETEKTKRSIIDRKIEIVVATSAKAISPTVVQARSVRILNDSRPKALKDCLVV